MTYQGVGSRDAELHDAQRYDPGIGDGLYKLQWERLNVSKYAYQWLAEDITDLFALEMAILNARLVDPKSFNGNELLST